jgi:hypothetical protein
MRTLLLTVALLGFSAAQGEAKLLLSKQDALALAFPGDTVEKKTAFLSTEQQRAIEKLARAKVTSRIWTYYVGKSTERVLGYAYTDSVLVRTHPAVIMTVIKPSGRVLFTEILTFDEPEDYLPRDRWLELFKDKPLNSRLRIRKGIPNIFGSTLSSQSITESVRRILALHAILHGQQGEKP